MPTRFFSNNMQMKQTGGDLPLPSQLKLDLLKFPSDDRHASRDLARSIVTHYDLQLPTRNAPVCMMMSGGIDSSFVAWLLKSLDYDVRGVYARCWSVQEEDDDQMACRADNDFADVVAVCKRLSIDCSSVDLTQQYWLDVFQPFLQQLTRDNQTPNPDIDCNRRVKFDAFFRLALNESKNENVVSG
jgi:asparagine synthetase B (glutamine-hydrolysing)